MAEQGSLAARRTPGCVFIAGLLLSVTLRAEPLPLNAPPRPFWSGTVSLLGSYAASPLRLNGRGAQIALLTGGALLALHQEDARLSKAVSTGGSRQPWLDSSMPTVSTLGEGWAEGGATALAWALGDERLSATSAQALQALAIAGVYTTALKTAFWSNRPSEGRERHRYFDYEQHSQSMPSGHTFSAFALAEVYGDEYGRFWSYPFALLMAYSRLYNQAHWPSDVVAGAILGVAAGYQVRQAARLQGPPQWYWKTAYEGGPKIALNLDF